MSIFDSYPYIIHTNRELDLMLSGQKPFAVFAHEKVNGFQKEQALNHQNFQPHLDAGFMTEHVRTYTLSGPNESQFDIDYWFYAIKGQEWRVDAYCLLLDARQACGWSAQLEWIEGTLLGYTEEQNRYHISQRYPDLKMR